MSLPMKFRPSCERLEERIAPAAVHTFVSANKVTYVDPDGDLVTVTSSKPIFTAGLGQFLWVASGQGEQLQKLTLPATAQGTSLTITAVRAGGLGDGFVNVGTIDADKVDVSSITVQGDLVKLLAGDATTTTPAVGTLKVQSMGRFGTSTQDVADVKSDIRGAVGKLIVASDVKGVWFKISATNEADGKIGSIALGGSLIGGSTPDSGSITATGGFGTIVIKGSIIGGSAVDAGRIAKSGSDSPGGAPINIKSLTIGGSIIGGSAAHAGEVESTGNIFSAKINGNLEGGTAAQAGRIEVAGDLPSLIIGGSILGGRHNSTGEVVVGGTLKKLAVTGSVVGGDSVGAAAVSETGYVQAAHIGSITVGGSVTAGNKVGAGALDKSGSIRSANEIGSVSIVGDLRGTPTAVASIIAARSPSAKVSTISAITVGGTVERANILAGYDVNGAATEGAVSIGKVTVAGDWVASNLVAGFTDGGDGIFGNANDTRIGTPAVASRIAAISILGQVVGTAPNPAVSADPVNSDGFGIVASNISALKIGTTTFPLNPALNTDVINLSSTTGQDVRVKETFA